jgi:hypothetical protein
MKAEWGRRMKTLFLYWTGIDRLPGQYSTHSPKDSVSGAHRRHARHRILVYEKSTDKILLFGGGLSLPSSDAIGDVSQSFGDTWEYDPATHVWTERKPTASPSVRHDFTLVWDASRNKAVLFGGLQTDVLGAQGIPKQDTWEWDPTAATWTDLFLLQKRRGRRKAKQEISGHVFSALRR